MLELKGEVNYLNKKAEFKYWEVEGFKIPKNYQSILHKNGIKHVIDCLAKGFTEGELPPKTYMSDDLMFTGWWQLKDES